MREITMRERTQAAAVFLALASLGTLFGCDHSEAPDLPAKDKIEVPIAPGGGINHRLYAVAGWSKDSIRKAWGIPTRIAKERKDFTNSINDKSWNQFRDEEVEQWRFLEKSGMMQTLVTFDAKGNAVRAIREWSCY